MESEIAPSPHQIFGLAMPGHRVTAMRQVLRIFGVRYKYGDLKQHLFDKLELLEKLSSEQCWQATAAFLDHRDAQPVPDEETRKRVASSLLELITMDQAASAINKPKECDVCMERRSLRVFPHSKITVTCSHEPTICLRCLQQSIETQIQDAEWDQITCPLCPELLSFQDVKKHATSEAFQRYDRKSVIASLNHMPNFTMCLGPNCDSGQIHRGGDDQPIMTCTTCQFKTCFTHNLPWHAGQTCEEYDAQRQTQQEQEAASEAYLARETKICPSQACRIHAVKINGCDHMTCHRCRYEFCWICLFDYRRVRHGDNSAHERNCQYYSDNVARDDEHAARLGGAAFLLEYMAQRAAYIGMIMPHQAPNSPQRAQAMAQAVNVPLQMAQPPPAHARQPPQEAEVTIHPVH